MRRKKEQNVLFSKCQIFQNAIKIKLFINVYNAAHETLKLLGQGGYRSSSTTFFINCLNITFMRVFKELIRKIDKKYCNRICFNCCFLRYFQ